MDAITTALKSSERRDMFRFATPIFGATHTKLASAYRERPTVLHFAGHGDDRSLAFLLDQDVLVRQAPLIADQLAGVLHNWPFRVRLCVLNTCASEPVARQLVDTQVIDAAVGWPSKLTDAAAIAFSKTFYGSLGDGLGLERSVKLAAETCGSECTPTLYVGATGAATDVWYPIRNDK
jgi:hypothetical protein